MALLPLTTLALSICITGHGQAPAPAPAKAPAATEFHFPTPAERAAIMAASAKERDRELKLLGITAMQPPATAYDIGKPGNANYDEAKANPFPKLPALLVFNNGKKVKTAADWAKRRKEIEAMFAEDVYGKYPAHIPAVTWKVDSVEEMTVAGVPAIVKHITGHVDNSEYPAITVDIHADVVTPASTRGKKVPVIIGGGTVLPFTFHFPPPRPGQMVHRLAMPDNPPDSTKLLLEAGWGFVARNSNECRRITARAGSKGLSAW